MCPCVFAALTYLASGEYPEIFKLRVEMLTESGCDSLALNLAEWCLKCPRFEGDKTLILTQLVILSKLGKKDDVVSMVSLGSFKFVSIANCLYSRR